MNTKLKCLLLDDELPGLAYLKMLCEQIPELEVIKAFNTPENLLAERSLYDFDFCILDIEMPQMNGLQVAELLKGKPVIFTTAYKEYAAEAFDLNAVDYIRKPVKKERLIQSIEKIRVHLEGKPKNKSFIQLNTDKGKAILFFDQLLYIKISDIDSRDKIALLADGGTLTIKNITFDKLKTLLPKKDFVQVNKKEMIAVRCVKLFSTDEITSSLKDSKDNNIKLKLSEVYRNELLEKIGI